MDNPNKVHKYKSTKSTKVLITQPFFELKNPDVAWKFVRTVQINFEKNLKNKMTAKKQNGH